MTNAQRSLTPGDLEFIERLVNKDTGDIAVALGRSFERLEERIDAVESRLYSRLSDLEDKVEASRQAIADQLGEMRGEIREITHPREHEVMSQD